MIRKSINSGMLLVLSYLLGQGSYFVLLLFLKKEQVPEYSSYVVFYISLVSLAFQFSDVGGNTVGLKRYRDVGIRGAEEFVRGRAILAALVLALLLAIYKVYEGFEFSSSDALTVVLVGVVFAIIPLFLLDATESFFEIAVIQVIQWLFLTIGIYFCYIYELPLIYLSILLFIFAVLCFVMISRRTNIKFRPKLSKASFNDLMAPGSVIIPYMVGQIWGRIILLVVSMVGGLGAVVDYGIMKSIHGALSAIAMRLLRPIISRFVDTGIKEIPVLLFFILLLFSVVSYIILRMHSTELPFVDEDIGKWLPIIASIPVWVAGAYISSSLQVKNKGMYVLVEILSFCAHMAGVVAFMNTDLVLGLFLADLFKAIFVYIVNHLVRDEVAI